MNPQKSKHGKLDTMERLGTSSSSSSSTSSGSSSSTNTSDTGSSTSGVGKLKKMASDMKRSKSQPDQIDEISGNAKQHRSEWLLWLRTHKRERFYSLFKVRESFRKTELVSLVFVGGSC